jgi:hypothetical protein
MSQKQIILSYLMDLNDWEYEHKIRALDTPFGWIGARGDRDVRELIEEGKVDSGWRGKYRIVKHKEVEASEPQKQKIELVERDGRLIAVAL